LAVAELFKNNSIECLLRSIPIKELFQDKDIKYKKIEVKDDSLLKRYKVKKLPTFLFFRGGELIGKIEGYYNNQGKGKLVEKINKLLR